MPISFRCIGGSPRADTASLSPGLPREERRKARHRVPEGNWHPNPEGARPCRRAWCRPPGQVPDTTTGPAATPTRLARVDRLSPTLPGPLPPWQLIEQIDASEPAQGGGLEADLCAGDFGCAVKPGYVRLSRSHHLLGITHPPALPPARRRSVSARTRPATRRLGDTQCDHLQRSEHSVHLPGRSLFRGQCRGAAGRIAPHRAP
jgi:hypothetical protein